MEIIANIINHDNSFLGKVVIEKNKIVKVIKIKNKLDNNYNYLLPAFVDGHTHGGYGIDFNSILSYSNQEILDFTTKLYSEGVVHVAFTTVTTTTFELEKLSNWFKNNNYSSFIAFHIEGPFISKFKKGAHEEKEIILIDENCLNTILEDNKNKKIILTCAVEEGENEKILKKLLSKHKNFYVSIGHSNANYLQTNNYLNNKIVTRFTHLYNAMSGFDHRNPGIVFSAWTSKFGFVEMITDGYHINDDVTKFTTNLLDKYRIMLVSDSLLLKGKKDGNFILGHVPVTKKGQVCYIENTNTLAGSCSSYLKIAQHFYKITNCNLQDLVKVTSFNFYKSINLHNKYGQIKKGFIANLIEVDLNLDLKSTYFNGNKVYSVN